jgi:hypothetical protein
MGMMAVMMVMPSRAAVSTGSRFGGSGQSTANGQCASRGKQDCTCFHDRFLTVMKKPIASSFLYPGTCHRLP